MTTMVSNPVPHFKVFTYHTALDDVVGRRGTLLSKGRPDISVSAPIEFKGEAGYWTPEDLFVASVEVCVMLTVVGIAEKRDVDIVSYESSAEGTLQWQDKSYAFTHVVVRPTIVVARPEAVTEMTSIVERAHQTCVISNSITSKVSIEPSIIVATIEVE
jgi:organic hydroperoxide reductase OsmC/OhrA